MSTLFALEPLLISRLQSQVTTLRAVQGARDLAAVQNSRHGTPAAYILFDGQEGRMSAANLQVVDQYWLVVVTARNARDAVGEAERAEAGELLNAIVAALLGWCPDFGYAPLKLASTRAPSVSNGVGLYPLRFQARFII